MLQVIFTIQANCSTKLAVLRLTLPSLPLRNTLTRDSLAVLDIKGPPRRVMNTEQWNKKCYVDGSVMGLRKASTE